MKKIVYLVHPVDSINTIEDNIISLTRIIKNINLNYKDIIPFAPYFADIAIMNIRDREQMNRVADNDDEVLERRCFDEIWVVGEWDQSTVVKIMLNMGARYNVPIHNMTSKL